MLYERGRHLVFLCSIVLIGFAWLSSQPTMSRASILSEQGMLEATGARDQTVRLQQHRQDWVGAWLTKLDVQSFGSVSAPWSLLSTNAVKHVWLSRSDGADQLVMSTGTSMGAVKGTSEVGVAQGEQAESIVVVKNENGSQVVQQAGQLGMSATTGQQLSRLPYDVRHLRVAHISSQSKSRTLAAYVYDQLNTTYVVDVAEPNVEQALAAASLQQPPTSLSLAVLNRPSTQQPPLVIVLTTITQADGHKLVATACSPVGPDISDRIVDCGLPTVLHSYPLSSTVTLLGSVESTDGVRQLVREQSSDSVTTLTSIVIRQNITNGQLEMVESFAYNAVGSVPAASLLDLSQDAYLLGLIEAGELMLLHIIDTAQGPQVGHYPLPLPIRELSEAKNIADIRLQSSGTDMLLNIATSDAHVWSFQSAQPENG